jgi:hypothetical protein
MKTRDGDRRPAEVLLVEDTPGDVRLTLEAEALVKSINDFCLTNVTLPQRPPSG